MKTRLEWLDKVLLDCLDANEEPCSKCLMYSECGYFYLKVRNMIINGEDNDSKAE